MRDSPRFRILVGAAGLLLVTLPAFAFQARAAEAEETDSIVITQGAGNSGRVATNAAAGNHNQQANAAVLAIGGVAAGTGLILQSTDDATSSDTGPHTGQASAELGGNAFAQSTGMIGVNIVAGSENQTANLAIFALGTEGLALTDATLSQTRSSQQPTGEPQPGASLNSLVSISEGAFQGSRGLVQLNLIGGERNSSANLFALTTSAGAEP